MISRHLGRLTFHLCLLCVGIILSVSSLRIGVGIPTEPGSGFLPFGTGVLLAVVSLFGIWTDARVFEREKSEHLRGESRKRIIIIIGSLLVYVFTLSKFGYLLSTFLLMGVLFSLVERRNWLIIIVKAIIVTLITYLIFEKWLACQLPQGILWF